MSDEKKNYRSTLNLPQTSFPMKANLTQREPQMRKQWAKTDIYAQIREKTAGRPRYILHDGPPYANGDIHLGHVINKVLKDIVVKYKTMTGFDAPYVPGWDCHGLPIEAKIMTELGDKAKEMTKLEIRKLCQKYASKYVKLQTRQFQQLGVFGDFKNPYLTFKPQYEQGILEIFAKLVENGLVYKQLKPVHWSIGCETALADAELEYEDISSPSVHVNFPVTEESIEKLKSLGLVSDTDAAEAKVCFMIWTTTPWTLPANLAIAVNPALEYTTITYEKNGQKFTSILAAERVSATVEAAQLTADQYTTCNKTVKGGQLTGLRYNHPIVESNPTDKDAWMVIEALFITTEDGTGLVHIAPGHGVDDYVAGQSNGLAIYSPVGDDGRYDDTVPDWLIGKSVLKVNTEINSYLAEKNLLFQQSDILHSYPHCWRSKMPVIFRATEQWFIGVDREMPGLNKTLRNLALERIKKIKWIPAWGEKRIAGMLESRPDWCISRQRCWGMPIPVFYNSNGQTLLTKESVDAVAKHIGQKGSNSWFTDTPKEILGEDFSLPEGFDFDDLQKEENIFDVWFESGCSWHSVAVKRGWKIPVDLYLEGSDQHRGWFQLSLLPALGSIGTEPFKAVLTHGFTVDEKGKKQSKSLGNYVNAQDEIEKYGADILRLWVSSVNYQEDMRCNDELIGRLSDSYRKIRNTLRYLLGNIDDFDPGTDSVPYSEMSEIDKWATQQLQQLIADTTTAYENFAFHRVFSMVHNFCTVQMSSIYMDVLKDRLYCDGQKSLSRRSSQTAMSKIVDAIVRLLAPILAHTAEEAWAVMKFKSEDAESIHLASMPKVDDSIDYKTQEEKWQKIMSLRDNCLLTLEGLRQNKEIASNQEAAITITTGDEDTIKLLNDFGLDQFAGLCIVSEMKLEKAEGETKISAGKSNHKKCQRCWNYWPSVGTIDAEPDLCSRCSEVVSAGR